MSQAYDKILKENMEALVLPLADKLLGLSLGTTEELPDDLQTTLERKPDLLKRVTDSKKGLSYLLHIELWIFASLITKRYWQVLRNRKKPYWPC